MKTISKRHIDLSNYNTDELKINTNSASSICIQCDGISGEITVKGKNNDASTLISLTGISNSLATASSISADGLYSYDVMAVDNVELICTGNVGDIYIKVVD